MAEKARAWWRRRFLLRWRPLSLAPHRALPLVAAFAAALAILGSFFSSSSLLSECMETPRISWLLPKDHEECLSRAESDRERRERSKEARKGEEAVDGDIEAPAATLEGERLNFIAWPAAAPKQRGALPVAQRARAAAAMPESMRVEREREGKRGLHFPSLCCSERFQWLAFDLLLRRKMNLAKRLLSPSTLFSSLSPQKKKKERNKPTLQK